MGNFCVGNTESNENEHPSITEEQEKILKDKNTKNGKYKGVDNDSSSDSDEDEDEDDDNEDNNSQYNQLQIETMQKEVIILSTRNANLEQQLEEMKKKYNALQQQQSFDSADVYSTYIYNISV